MAWSNNIIYWVFDYLSKSFFICSQNYSNKAINKNNSLLFCSSTRLFGPNFLTSDCLEVRPNSPSLDPVQYSSAIYSIRFEMSSLIIDPVSTKVSSPVPSFEIIPDSKCEIGEKLSIRSSKTRFRMWNQVWVRLVA